MHSMQYTPSSAKLFQALHILSIVRHNGGVLSPCQLLELVASQWIPIDVPTWDPCTKVIPSSVIYSAGKKNNLKDCVVTNSSSSSSSVSLPVKRIQTEILQQP